MKKQKTIGDLKLNDCFRLNWDNDEHVEENRTVYLVTNISGTGDQRTVHATGRRTHQIFWPHTYDFPVAII